MDSPHVFDGLSKKLPACLRALRRNNSSEWFHAHKEEYQRNVVTPLAALAETLTPDMALLDSSLVKKLSRPQRDTRFSRDKSPYRTVMWFAFRRVQPDWTEYPAFFFEARPEDCCWGIGYYAARPATMSALRDIVLEDPKRFLTAKAAAADRGFTLEGEEYKRLPPVPADTPEEITDLARRRNVFLSRTMGYETPVLNSELAEVLAADFAALGALYHLFCMANERLQADSA
ncbi:TIGR02453 family protein [Betaproteobacteria bacterium]|nr:TIGR02453 family protein [Betaproteobacteria bacterium]